MTVTTHRNVLVCASPTCSASFGISPFQSLAAQLRARGWRMVREPSDDRARPFCERCAT